MHGFALVLFDCVHEVSIMNFMAMQLQVIYNIHG